MKYGQRRIYAKDDKILKNAIVLTANELKLGGNNRNFPNCNTDKCIAAPNDGNR